MLSLPETLLSIVVLAGSFAVRRIKSIHMEFRKKKDYDQPN